MFGRSVDSGLGREVHRHRVRLWPDESSRIIILLGSLTFYYGRQFVLPPTNKDILCLASSSFFLLCSFVPLSSCAWLCSLIRCWLCSLLRLCPFVWRCSLLRRWLCSPLCLCPFVRRCRFVLRPTRPLLLFPAHATNMAANGFSGHAPWPLFWNLLRRVWWRNNRRSRFHSFFRTFRASRDYPH
jgi:hypothetical protein